MQLHPSQQLKQTSTDGRLKAEEMAGNRKRVVVAYIMSCDSQECILHSPQLSSLCSTHSFPGMGPEFYNNMDAVNNAIGAEDDKVEGGEREVDNR
eukprot:754187-Hanusia_phi.AAC.5